MNRKTVEQKFNELAEWLKSIGANPDPSWTGHRYFVLATKAGTLRIHLDIPDCLRIARSFWIFCRFDDIKKACEVLELPKTCIDDKGKQRYDSSHSRLNPYSGKWNFGCEGLDELIVAFKCELGQILEPVTV